MAAVVVDHRGIPPRGERMVPMVPPGGAVGEEEEEEIEKVWPLGGATVVMVAMVTEIKSSNSFFSSVGQERILHPPIVVKT